MLEKDIRKKMVLAGLAAALLPLGMAGARMAPAGAVTGPYVVTDLDAMLSRLGDSFTVTHPTGLSPEGHAVGWANYSHQGNSAHEQGWQFSPISPNASSGSMADLDFEPSPSCGPNCPFLDFIPYGVNDSGQVAATGTYYNPNGNTNPSALVEQGGSLTYLPAPQVVGGCNNGGNACSHAFAINRTATVAGSYQDQTVCDAAEWAPPYSTTTSLPGACDPQTFAFPSAALALNDAADATGFTGTRDPVTLAAIQHAFVFAGGSMTRVGPVDSPTGLQGDYAVGTAINNSDEIVGEDGGFNHWRDAFVYSSGHYTDIDCDTRGQVVQGCSNGPGTGGSSAHGVNDAGAVVGAEGIGGPAGGGLTGRAFIWTPANGMTQLDTLIGSNPQGITLTNALAINDAGQILAEGTINGDCCGRVRAYLLTPPAQHSPVVVTPTTLPNAVAGVAYAQPISASGGVAPYSFAVTSGALPPGWTLDPSGALSGTATRAGTFNFTVTASDSSSGQASQAYSVQVALGLGSLPSGTINQAYSSTITVTGATGAASLAVTSGALPPGLTLDPSTGTLSGTPSTAGTFGFTVSATDSAANQGSRAYSLPIALQLTPPSLPRAKQGANYDHSIKAHGGTAPYTFSVASGSLPPGLSLDTHGEIAGSPTTPGTYTFTISATDAASPANTGTQQFTVQVKSRS